MSDKATTVRGGEGMADPQGSQVAGTASPNIKIDIQVGEKLFVTTRDTLCLESTFFESLLSRPSFYQDGTHYIDADPDLFAHVLRYLRHGIFPLAFDRQRGHDYSLYAGVLQLARQFKVEHLERWLVTGMYDGAVVSEVVHSNEVVEMEANLPRQACKPNVARQVSFVSLNRRVYKCPRGISVHTTPDQCGSKCENATTSPAKLWETQPYLRVQTIERVYIMYPDNCLVATVEEN